MAGNDANYSTNNVSIRSEGGVSSSIFGNGLNQTKITVSALVMQGNVQINGKDLSGLTVTLVDYNKPTITPLTSQIGWKCDGSEAGSFYNSFNVVAAAGGALSVHEDVAGLSTWDIYVSSTLSNKQVQLGVQFKFPDGSIQTYYCGENGESLNAPNQIIIKVEEAINYSLHGNCTLDRGTWSSKANNTPWSYSPLGYPDMMISNNNGFVKKRFFTIYPNITTPISIKTFNDLTTIDPVKMDYSEYKNAPVVTISSPICPDAITQSDLGGGHIVAWYLSPSCNDGKTGAITLGFNGANSKSSMIQFTSRSGATFYNQAATDQSTYSVARNAGALNSDKQINIVALWVGIDTTDSESLAPSNWKEDSVNARMVNVCDDYGNKGTFCIDFDVTDSDGRPSLEISY
jgi:hypothetical protein